MNQTQIHQFLPRRINVSRIGAARLNRALCTAASAAVLLAVSFAPSAVGNDAEVPAPEVVTDEAVVADGAASVVDAESSETPVAPVVKSTEESSVVSVDDPTTRATVVEDEGEGDARDAADPERNAVVVDSPAVTTELGDARVVNVPAVAVDPESVGAPIPLLVPPPTAPQPATTTDGDFSAGPFFDPSLGPGLMAPFRAAVSEPGVGRFVVDGRLLGTSSLHQDHRVGFAWKSMFGSPETIEVRAGFFASSLLPYCGQERECTQAEARAHVERLGVSPSESPRVARDFYLERTINSWARVRSTTRVMSAPIDFDVHVGWRTDLFVDGELGDKDGDQAPDFYPYTPSLRATESDAGLNAFTHGPTLGIRAARVDDENRPRRGFILRLETRARTAWLGSALDMAGVAGALEAFLPLTDDAVTFASRTLFDVQAGASAPLERGRFHVDDGTLGFGGGDVGRGIRLARFRGLVKAAEQFELRYDRTLDSLFYLPVSFGATAFLDVGYVAESIERARLDADNVHFGIGVGVRAGVGPILWRAELAASPDEGFAPFPYLSVGTSF